MPEKCENDIFTLKTRRLFSIHTTPITGQSGFVFEENRSGKSHDHSDVIIFELCLQSVYRPHENEKPAFSNNSSGLKSVFEKLPFRDGLSWTVGLFVEKKHTLLQKKFGRF